MFRDLGTKQIIHRLLSAGPFFFLALLSVFATPSTQGNKDIFWSVNELFNDMNRTIIGLFIVSIYFSAWWWTSLPDEPVNPRKRLHVTLRNYQSKFAEYRSKLVQSVSDEEFLAIATDANLTLNNLQDWTTETMSENAWTRLQKPIPVGLHYAFNGEGFDSSKKEYRNSCINGIDGYINALDELIKYDGWDK